MTPWLFVGMHRPMYVPYPHKSNRIVGRHLQDILEDLFLEREVDLVMTGHVHLYARTCSVRRDHCRKDDDGGITHVTVGKNLHPDSPLAAMLSCRMPYCAICCSLMVLLPPGPLRCSSSGLLRNAFGLTSTGCIQQGCLDSAGHDAGFRTKPHRLLHAGCGGHKLSEIEDDQKAWIAEAASHHGYGRVTVESGSSLLWEYVRNKDGRVHDSVRIGNSQLDRRRCNAAGAAVSALLQNQTAGLSQGLAALQAVTAAQSASDAGALVLSAVRDGGRL